MQIKNPCYDPEYVNVRAVNFQPTLQTYMLGSPALSFSHDSFVVVTQPVEHELCGKIAYKAVFEVDNISVTSEPLAYDAAT